LGSFVGQVRAEPIADRAATDGRVKAHFAYFFLVGLWCCACGHDESLTHPHGDPLPNPLSAEAGLLDLPMMPMRAESSGRLFYSFQPASHPDRAPLLVFFNGGPGAATTGILLPFGTGPFTLDPTSTDDPPHENPHSYTAFGNLLYIDTRQAGFSYDTGNPDPDPYARCRLHSEPLLYIADAAEVLFALLDFLDSHERLRDNPVVLVGESYGGTRAALMLYLLQHHADLEAPTQFVREIERMVPGLRERIAAHFNLAFADSIATPDEVAAQFGWQVLIQPSLAGAAQADAASPIFRNDPDFRNVGGEADIYDVRVSAQASLAIFDRVQRTMRNPVALEALLGVELYRISGLAGTERGAAFRVFGQSPVPMIQRTHDGAAIRAAEEQLRVSMGELGTRDAYFLPYGQPCADFLGDENTLLAFKDVLTRTKTFITNARWDSVVYTEALPALLELELDLSLPEGAERSGVLHGNGTQIRFPTYESGHMVTMNAPAKLSADVHAWLEAEGALGH
jgi:hypothetical protein